MTKVQPEGGIVGRIISAEVSDGEPDRATVHANGLVVDVIANSDGSVYVETYAYHHTDPEGLRQQVVVQHMAVDRYTDRHPNFRLEIAHVR